MRVVRKMQDSNGNTESKGIAPKRELDHIYSLFRFKKKNVHCGGCIWKMVCDFCLETNLLFAKFTYFWFTLAHFSKKIEKCLFCFHVCHLKKKKHSCALTSLVQETLQQLFFSIIQNSVNWAVCGLLIYICNGIPGSFLRMYRQLLNGNMRKDPMLSNWVACWFAPYEGKGWLD